MLELFKHIQPPLPLTIESVRDMADRLYQLPRIKPMQKIRVKSWLAHSESREKSENPPFHFDVFTSRMGYKQYVSYVELDYIDCADLGGKEGVLKVLATYYNQPQKHVNDFNHHRCPKCTHEYLGHVDASGQYVVCQNCHTEYFHGQRMGY